MASFLVAGRSILGAVLVSAALLAPFAAADAQSRVGVTQVTSGDPLGRPPVGAERILRVGTDVQANEAIITASNDRAHLIFLDGTTLSVGPNAQLVIDKYVYDTGTERGELAISVTKGVMRLIGGRISKNDPITVKTPSSTIGIRGGIAAVGVEPATAGAASTTVAIFFYGDRMTVTAGGVTQTVTLPGQQVSTTQGSPPGPVTIVVQGTLAATVNALAGNTTASAAVLASINAIVASTLTTAQMQVALTSLIQTPIQQSSPVPGLTALNSAVTPINTGEELAQAVPGLSAALATGDVKALDAMVAANVGNPAVQQQLAAAIFAAAQAQKGTNPALAGMLAAIAVASGGLTGLNAITALNLVVSSPGTMALLTNPNAPSFSSSFFASLAVPNRPLGVANSGIIAAENSAQTSGSQN